MSTPATATEPTRQCASAQHQGERWLPLSAFPVWRGGRRRVVCAACLRRMDPAVMAAREAEEAQRAAAEAERERQDELLRREALAERIKEWIEETYFEVRRYVPEDWVASSTAARLMAQVMVRYAEELGPLDRGGDLGHPEVLHDLKMVRALIDILIRAGEFQAEQSRVYLEQKRAKMAEQQQAMRMTAVVVVAE